jgi:hypothetical protein
VWARVITVEGVGVTVALLVVAAVATVVVVVCETLVERRRRRWLAWLEAAVAIYIAVDLLGFRVAAVPWLLWSVTAVMVAVAVWRFTELRRDRAGERT